jgi:ABC-type Fe3+ transport system permease subunit
LIVAAVLMFLLTFADGETAAIIAPPGATPLAVRIGGLLHYGPSDLIHAASLLTGCIVLASMLLTGFAAGRLARWNS